ncbi:methylmalonyl-CoA mutase family protein [Streptomyces sp. NPDC002640]
MPERESGAAVGPATAPRPWTSRRYTGHGTAVESNARYRRLTASGTTDLSVAFDLPTRTGHDSDASFARGEVGKAGVAVDSVDDMRVLFAGIPLDRVRPSLDVDAPAAVLLLLYQLVAEERVIHPGRLTGTVRNDVLEEHAVRGTCAFPPGPSLRLVTDTIAYCRDEIPRWNALAVCGHRMAAAGASPSQEIAFTLADGIAYVRAAVAAGLDVDDVVTRVSFRLAARATAAEEAAEYRAVRRLWGRAMREEFGVRGPGPAVLRVPAHGTDVTAAVGRCAGPHLVARTADEVEWVARELMGEVEELGGAVAALELGFQQGEIARGACRGARETGTEPGGRAVTGVDPAYGARQAERLAKLRAWRFQEDVDAALVALRETAAGTGNVLHPLRHALRARATVGEVCGALRDVWGTYTYAPPGGSPADARMTRQKS